MSWKTYIDDQLLGAGFMVCHSTSDDVLSVFIEFFIPI